jgi:hydroxymethylglutaryl-CoA reductase (NADPH)
MFIYIQNMNLPIIKPYSIENIFDLNNEENYKNAIIKRREYYSDQNLNFDNIPFDNYNYKQIHKKNCENVIGFIPVPLAIIGPILINDNNHFIPFSTTEGALVASLTKCTKLINENNGVSVIINEIGMTRSPIIKLNNIFEANDLIKWLNDSKELIKSTFESTTRFGKLINFTTYQIGNEVHIRLVAHTGDAMGMNMISKGANKIIKLILDNFPEGKLISLSGNTCTDKKNSSMNYIMGRGREANVSINITNESLVKNYNINIDQFDNINKSKNLVGSAIAGTIGGNNCHIANIIAGLFLATGQDLAQIGTSSYGIVNTCIKEDNSIDIYLRMPCIEVGTIGGGTTLDVQKQCINIMGIDNTLPPSENANMLASIFASLCLIGEISLLSSLANNTLVDGHMKLNR